MDLFKSRGGMVTSGDLEKSLMSMGLEGKNVLVYSRLLSLGRFLGKEAVLCFIELLRESVGTEGTLIIPTYTLNTYNQPREFDFNTSKIMSGVLGELAAKSKEFKRTVHPIYSNCISGKETSTLLEQNSATSFGSGSFFDLFSNLDNTYVMMIGLNFNGPTLYHYYEQKFEAKGRFIKSFDVKLSFGDYTFNGRFDSYVKDHTFYENKTNCLARFDALVESFSLVKRYQVGDDFIHIISEREFQLFYRSALDVDQKYFLLGSESEWETYYLRNKFDLYHNDLNLDLVEKVRLHTGYTIKKT